MYHLKCTTALVWCFSPFFLLCCHFLLDLIRLQLHLSADPSLVLCQINWPELEWCVPIISSGGTAPGIAEREDTTNANLCWLMLGNSLRVSSIANTLIWQVHKSHTGSIFHSFRHFYCLLPDVLSCVSLLWRPLRLFSPCSETAMISPTGHFISLVIHMFFGTKNILQVEMKCVQEQIEARGDLFYGVRRGFFFFLTGGWGVPVSPRQRRSY